MASRIIHLTCASILAKELKLKDNHSFIIGHLIPDAIAFDNETHAISHYKTSVHNDTKNMMDYYAFRDQFNQEIKSDEVVLGYFFHLVQDAVYRKFLYIDHNFISYYGEEFRMALYNDYQLLNQYLISTYQLKKVANYSDEKISAAIRALHPFYINTFIREVNGDFNSSGAGETKYFTEKMADEYIKLAVSVCLEEYQALLDGFDQSDPVFYAWDRKNRGS